MTTFHWARCGFLCAALCIVGMSPLFAQTGSVSGQVSNAATGAFLEGAAVRLDPAGLSVFTSREGRFSFPAVPAGPQTLTVSYTGLDPQTIALQVGAGATEVRNVELTSEVYQLEKFVVPGEREGNALAITMQRIAPNVKNVLSSDAFGNIADQNLGNFLLRLPGIGTEKSEGEIFRVQVRGVNADLNAVTIDGTRAASGSTRGLSRGFEIDKIPADFIETIEVTKAPTPDMDADSIGGTVNLKTKSALDRRERVISYTAGTSFNPDRETFVPLGNFMYSDRLGQSERIGVLLTTSFSQSHKPRDSSNVAWERTTETNRPVYFYRTDIGEDELKHTRAGLGVRLDYKLSETASVYVNTMYSYYKDHLGRRRGNANQGVQLRVVDRVNPNGTAVDAQNRAASIMPGWTDTVTNTVNHRFRLVHLDRDRDLTTWNFQFGGEKRWANRALLDYNANFSPSEGTERRYIVNGDVAGVGFRHEREGDGKIVKLTQTHGADIYDINSFALAPSTVIRGRNKDEILGAQVNLRVPFETKFPSYLKTGIRLREQKRNQDFNVGVFNYTGTNSVQFYDPGYNYASYGGVYRPLPFYDIFKVANAFEGGSAEFQRDIASSIEDSIVDDGDASESVYAGYIMGGVSFGKLNVLAGVRVEETRLDATGFVEELTPEEEARRAAWVGPVTDAEAERRALAEFGNRRSASSKYSDVFPGIHLRYEIAPGLVARASWSTGIGRPNYDTLLPVASINHEDQEIEANNTDLQPQYSDNYDLVLEYYFEPAGLVSVGAFKKDIKDFIFSDNAGTLGPGNRFGDRYVGYELTTDFNGGSAEVKGLEFAYQQQFSFLPGFWKGFGAFANYTYLKSEGNYGGPGTVVTNAELENFVPRTANVGISYIGHNWTVRAQMNYTGVHLDSFDSDASRRQYIFENYPVDLNLRYDFSPRLGVFLDVINVFNEPTNHEFTFTEYRRNRNDLYTTMWKLGISGRF